ncbi:MAG: YraN family protein [Syntrophobacteraceae bacterium]|jgi:putative endonuclease|nr:YraN family protein [Syntrophobacteraceae bacterium]
MSGGRQQKGREAEELAAGFLAKQGLDVVARNVRCLLGEIDLVAWHGKTVVFVEVKSRFTRGYGTPQEMVSELKQKRLTRLAQWYLKKHGLLRQPARFDVVAIQFHEGEPVVTWIANAFPASE